MSEEFQNGNNKQEAIGKQWEAALARTDRIVKRNNPEASDTDIAGLNERTKQSILDLAGSDMLKLVVTTGTGGHDTRTVEPGWAETPGFGIPASTYAELMGLDEPTSFDHLEPVSGGLVEAIADSADKPVSALIDGQYIEPVNPVVKAA